MANNTPDSDTLLKKLNDEKAFLMIPAILYLAVLLVLGIVGNFAVCYYYGLKTKRTSNTTFIIVLAAFDLASCSLSIPTEIVDLIHFYIFQSKGACKMMRFVNNLSAIGSGVTLLIIAIDRYRHICKPFAKQISLKVARLFVLVPMLSAIVLSWPSLVFNEPVSVVIKIQGNMTIVGLTCTTTKDQSYKLYLYMFNGLHFLCFLVFTVILSIVYALIGRVIYQHKKLTSSITESIYDNTETRFSHVTTPQIKQDINKFHNTDTEGTEPEPTPDLKDPDLKQDSRKSTHTRKHVKKTSMKSAVVMLNVTFVFILSFLPYLILTIWRMFLDVYEGEILSDSQLVAFQIGIRSYFINSASNPLIYGFFNPRFRKLLLLKLCPCYMKCKRDRILSASYSETTLTDVD